MQRVGGDHPAPSGSAGWGDEGPDSQLLFITSTCVMYCVLNFQWSPQPLWTPYFARGEVSNFSVLTPAPPFSFQRVQLVSEPCTLSINGVIFGLTSTDLLFHMGAEEISR